MNLLERGGGGGGGDNHGGASGFKAHLRFPRVKYTGGCVGRKKRRRPFYAKMVTLLWEGRKRRRGKRIQTTDDDCTPERHLFIRESSPQILAEKRKGRTGLPRPLLKNPARAGRERMRSPSTREELENFGLCCKELPAIIIWSDQEKK